MMSDIDNLDILLGNSGENPIERELADAIESPNAVWRFPVEVQL